MATLTRRESVGVVTLDRPPANAIDAAILDSLYAICDEIEADDSIKAVVIVGSPKVFCAGVDIKMISGFLAQADGEKTMLAFVRRIQGFYTRWHALGAPTIAALEGSATGGGLEFALASDLRVAADSARFGLTEVNIGLLPGAGGTQRLSRIAGIATATRLILTGDLVSGSAAEQLGIVHVSVPRDGVQAIAFGWAEELSKKSGSALREIKNCLRLAPSPEGFAAEVDGSARLLAEPGTKDFVNSFFARD